MKLGLWGAKRSSRGLMLVGDAGNMGHPVCGEGYGGAMESGRIALSLEPIDLNAVRAINYSSRALDI